MVATRKSSILGPNGQPVEVALLSQEIAEPTFSGVRSVHMDSVAGGLTPERLASVLRDAAMGHARAYLTLAMEMEERYLHYASQLQVRRLAFDAIDHAVTVPKNVPAKIGDAVHELVNDPGFRDACSDLTDAIGKSYSVVELIWDYDGKYLRPVRYKHRDPRFFQFDRVTLEELRLRVDENMDGVPLPPGCFMKHMPRMRAGIPIRRGLARPAAWAFLIQSFTLQDWAAFAEIYGIPFRLGKYHANATADDKRTLLRAVKSIANDAAAIIPQGMEIEFKEVSGNQGEKVFGGLLSYVDKQISKLVLGQTMTADDGSSLGQAKVHNEVRLDILRADCRQTEATVNRDLIRWFVAMNFGPQEVYPTVDFPVSEPEDIKAVSEAVAKLVPLGFRVSQRNLREKMSLSTPEEDDEVLGSPQPAPADKEPKPKPAKLAALPHGTGCRCAGCAPARLSAEPVVEDEPDAVDAVMAAELANWQEITDPLLETLFARAAAASSYEEVLADLDRLRLDSTPLRESVARANAIARGIGDAEG